MLTQKSPIQKFLSRAIAFHPIYADLTGSVTTAIFLQQCIYWTEVLEVMPNRQDGWFYKTYKQWYAETRLTRKYYEKARKDLKEIGILCERKGKDNLIYFKIDMTQLIRKLEQLDDPDHESTDPPNTNVPTLCTKVQTPVYESANPLHEGTSPQYIHRVPKEENHILSNDENKNISFEVQSIETTPQLDTTEEAIPNSPLAKKSEVETGDQGLNPQSEKGEGFPPCSKNVNSASHKQESTDKPKDPFYAAVENRQAYRKKQKSGEFKDEHLADKFSPLFVEQGKAWGKHPQEVFEGFEAFILQKSKDKANPQGYAIVVIAKTVESFNQGKISEQYLWNEYLKANKPPATEPDQITYLSAINLFKTFCNSNMDFAKLQIEDVCKKLNWTFEQFVEYARTKGDLLDFSFN